MKNCPKKIVVLLLEISTISSNECWFNCWFTLCGDIINLTDISACGEEINTFLKRKIS